MTTTSTRPVVVVQSRRRDRTPLIVAAWVGLLVAAVTVGVQYRSGKAIEVGAVPWVGRWGFDPALVPHLLVVVAACAAAAWWLPQFVTSEARDRSIVIAAAAVAMVLALLFAWAGPPDTRWVSLRFGYGAHTHLVDDWHGPVAFLRHYVARQPRLTAHLRAHPPGLVLALWAAARVGLTGRAFDLAAMLGAGGVATAAALVAARNAGGPALMRAAAPFVAVGPVLVWRTNPDVIFAAAGMVAVSLVVVATSATGRRRDLLAVAGGVAFAATLFCSYGLTLLVVPMLAVGAYRRAWRALAIAGAVTLLGLGVPALAGFSWLAGLAETRVQYAQSIAHVRGYRYWLLGNAAIYAALLGPAVCVGLIRLRRSVTGALIVGGSMCAALAGLSGLSSAETERIWQPFVPLALLAGAALWTRHADGTTSFDLPAARRWLALQTAVAIVFQAFLWTRV